MEAIMLALQEDLADRVPNARFGIAGAVITGGCAIICQHLP
jgi:hypothetical protein